MRLGKHLVAAAAVLAIVAVAGCGSKSSSGSGSGSTTAPTSGGTTSGSAAATGSPVKVALLADLSGEYATTFVPVKAGVEAFVDYYNARGGVNGHKLELSVYDDASSPSQTLANARLAVSNGAQAIICQEILLASAIPYLASTGVPVFGFGLTPTFFGANRTNFFSWVGNLITAVTNTFPEFYVHQEHYTNVAVASDSVPSNSSEMPALVKAFQSVGANVDYTNFAVDDTSSASLLALAEKLKSTKTQFIYTNFLAYAPAQLQADLNQVGSKIVVGNGILGFDPNIPKQFGPAANGMAAFLYSASWVDPNIPGVQTYLSAMQQYQSASEYDQQALYGWDAMVALGGALQALGSQSATAQNIVTAANSLQNFTGNGILQPMSFPAFHTGPPLCQIFGVLENGTWKAVSGTPSNPFFCGNALSS